MDIIFFAFVALYIFYKLYMMLGQESGKQNFLNQFHNIKDITDTDSGDIVSQIELFNNHKFSNIFTQINAQDNSFSEEKFIKGAKSAFELVIKAFCAGDKELLQSLLKKNIYDQFVRKIDEAADRKNQVSKILVSINQVEIIDAKIEGKIAIITVKFVSEQINFTKNANEELIEGDLSTINKLEDIWKFSKDIAISNPNWLLSDIS
jgi:predicted lipid-binding transport protein (Tim44 family)